MEQILLLAIFLLVGLANALIRWLRQRTEERTQAPTPEPSPPSRTRTLPPGARVHVQVPPPEALVPAARRTPAPALAPAPDPHTSRRRPAHRRLGSSADVRRAIVVMTVLGPCRALEPEPGIRTPWPAGS